MLSEDAPLATAWPGTSRCRFFIWVMTASLPGASSTAGISPRQSPTTPPPGPSPAIAPPPPPRPPPPAIPPKPPDPQQLRARSLKAHEPAAIPRGFPRVWGAGSSALAPTSPPPLEPAAIPRGFPRVWGAGSWGQDLGGPDLAGGRGSGAGGRGTTRGGWWWRRG